MARGVLADISQVSPISRGAQLFDHLGGAQQNRWRYGKAKRLGGLAVQDHLELGRELHREIARLLAAQNAIDIGGGTRKGATASRSLPPVDGNAASGHGRVLGRSKINRLLRDIADRKDEIAQIAGDHGLRQWIPQLAIFDVEGILCDTAEIEIITRHST